MLHCKLATEFLMKSSTVWPSMRTGLAPFKVCDMTCTPGSRLNLAVAFDAQDFVLVDAKAERGGDHLQPSVVGHPVDGCPVDAPTPRHLDWSIEHAFDIGSVVPS